MRFLLGPCLLCWLTGLGLEPYTVSLATFAASSVSIAICTALAKSRSVSLILKSAQDCLVVHRANESLSQGFILGISNGCEVTGGCVLTNACCQLLDAFARLPIHAAPELETFSYNQQFWSHCSFMNVWICSIVSLLTSVGSVCWAARVASCL